MNFKGRDRVSHVPQHLAGMDERVDNSCKQRAEYLCRSLIIVHTEHGQCQTCFIQEKSACFAEVSVTEQIYRNFKIPRNPGGNSVYQALFSSPTHKSLGTRLGQWLLGMLDLSHTYHSLLCSVWE